MIKCIGQGNLNKIKKDIPNFGRLGTLYCC